MFRKIIKKIQTNHTVQRLGYTFGGKGVAFLSFFLLDILIAQFLGYAGYNEWQFVFAILCALRWITKLGIDSAGKTYIASAKEKQPVFFSAAFDLSIICGVVIVVIGECILIGMNKFISFSDAFPNLNGLLFIGLFYSVGYGVFQTLYHSYIGIPDFKTPFFMTVIEYGLYLTLGVAGMLLWGEYGLVLSFVLTVIVVILYGYFKKPTCTISFSGRKAERAKLFQYAKYAAFANVGDMVLADMDSLMLGMMASTEVGIYAIGKNLLLKLSNIPVGITVSCMTKFGDMNDDNVEEMKRYFYKMLKITLGISLAISAGTIALGWLYIRLCYGEEYMRAYPVLCILILYFILYSLASLLGTFLNYRKKIRSILQAQALLIAFNLVGNLLLIRLYGALGAAIASGLAMIPYCIYLFVSSKKEFAK